MRPQSTLRQVIPKSIAQLWMLVSNRVSVRNLLLNRYTVTALVLIMAVGGAVAYTSINDEARIHGTVVNADGEPVANATVELERLDVEAVPESRTTTTDQDGHFEFEDQGDVLEFRIWATSDGIESDRKHEHLLYTKQSRELTLVIRSTK